MGVKMTAPVVKGKLRKLSHFLLSKQKMVAILQYIELIKVLKVTKGSGSTAIGFELVLYYFLKSVKMTLSVFLVLMTFTT